MIEVLIHIVINFKITHFLTIYLVLKYLELDIFDITISIIEKTFI